MDEFNLKNTASSDGGAGEPPIYAGSEEDFNLPQENTGEKVELTDIAPDETQEPVDQVTAGTESPDGFGGYAAGNAPRSSYLTGNLDEIVNAGQGYQQQEQQVPGFADDAGRQNPPADAGANYYSGPQNAGAYRSYAPPPFIQYPNYGGQGAPYQPPVQQGYYRPAPPPPFYGGAPAQQGYTETSAARSAKDNAPKLPDFYSEREDSSNSRPGISVKVYIATIVTLICLFTAGLLYLLIDPMNIDNNTSGNRVNDPQEGTKIIDIKQSPTIPQGEYSAAGAFQKASVSVVGIVCYENNSDFGDTSNSSSQGTGIVMSEDGYIITNSHVISDRKSTIVEVVLSDGEGYRATVIGFDTRTDLAVLKIDADDLTPADFANSDELIIGQDVIAIGNPNGIEYQNSLTKGCVSAVNRTVFNSSVKYIQTDAAINPGNSGGPLVNLYGMVIGVNTAKIVAEQFEGMGFAIPSNTVKEICEDLVNNGYVAGRVRIGITGTPTSYQQQNEGMPVGIIIKDIASDSPLKGKDIHKGDVITKVDGADIVTFQDVYGVLAEHKAGDKINIEVYHPEGSGSSAKPDYKIYEITLVADEGQTQSVE